MAGMLPGVEAARRRRFHQKSNLSYCSSEIYISGYAGSSFTRRPSFCLYASSHEFHLSSNSSNMRKPINQTEYDESRLCAEAREAKKRLDERLQPHWRSETTTKRTSKIGDRRLRSLQDRPVIQVDSQAASEVPKLKKSGSKRLNWLKLNWKLSEQEECAVCLDQLKAAERLMQLACGHRFHAKCLAPWLVANAHCPCCRMEIPPSSKQTIL